MLHDISMGGFTDLIAWKEAAILVGAAGLAASQMRGYGASSAASQLVRAAESITSNIAEAHSRGVSLDALRFLRYAKGSADEVESHVRNAILLRRLPMDLCERMIDNVIRVRYLILRFAASIERRL
jgi:four helix bundle protein